MRERIKGFKRSLPKGAQATSLPLRENLVAVTGIEALFVSGFERKRRTRPRFRELYRRGFYDCYLPD